MDFIHNPVPASCPIRAPVQYLPCSKYTPMSAITRPQMSSRQAARPRTTERYSQQLVKEMKLSGRTNMSLSQQMGLRQERLERFYTFPTVTLYLGKTYRKVPYSVASLSVAASMTSP